MSFKVKQKTSILHTLSPSLYPPRLSKLGVTVYSASEIEKNLLSQAKELSHTSKDQCILLSIGIHTIVTSLCEPINWNGTTFAIDSLIKQMNTSLNSMTAKRTADYQRMLFMIELSSVEDILILRLKISLLNQIKRIKLRGIFYS